MEWSGKEFSSKEKTTILTENEKKMHSTKNMEPGNGVLVVMFVRCTGVCFGNIFYFLQATSIFLFFSQICDFIFHFSVLAPAPAAIDSPVAITITGAGAITGATSSEALRNGRLPSPNAK